MHFFDTAYGDIHSKLFRLNSFKTFQTSLLLFLPLPEAAKTIQKNNRGLISMHFFIQKIVKFILNFSGYSRTAVLGLFYFT